MNSSQGLAALKEIFPDFPDRLLETCLESSGNNVDQAVERIITLLRQQEQKRKKEKEKEMERERENNSFVIPAREYGGKCNYCNASKTGRISYGMEAERMTVADYQALIDRGWRRSGTWLYIPSNKNPDCCCKQYTIRLDVDKYEMHKSQTKVQKKFLKFISSGLPLPTHLDQKDKTQDTKNKDNNNNNNNNNNNKEKHTIKTEKSDTFNTKRLKQDKSKGNEQIDKLQQLLTEAVNEVQSSLLSLPSDSKFPILVTPIPPKFSSRGNYSTNVAIVMAGVASRVHSTKDSTPITPDQKTEQHKKRQEMAMDIANRIHKLLSPDLGASVYEDAFINFSIAVPKLESGPSTVAPNPAPVKTTPMPNLETETKSEVQPHKFTVEMVPATFLEEEYEVYKKYQINVHHDKPEKLTEKGYTNFLVTSPLIPQKIEGEGQEQKYGSFHMQYRIDGKLIAVGVVDVLPVCLSSVYFFYDPDYHSLSLGVYSAIKEIDWIKNIHSSVPALKYYYMGYYIHTCPKMKYKGDYHPSSLLCLSSYEWVPLSDCVPLLDKSNDYISFVSDKSKHVDISKQEMDEVIERVKIMLQGNVINLSDLNPKGIKIVDPLLRTYVEKVGPELALRMFFVIQQ